MCLFWEWEYFRAIGIYLIKQDKFLYTLSSVESHNWRNCAQKQECYLPEPKEPVRLKIDNLIERTG
jgi:hypothetical protein